MGSRLPISRKSEVAPPDLETRTNRWDSSQDSVNFEQKGVDRLDIGGRHRSPPPLAWGADVVTLSRMRTMHGSVIFNEVWRERLVRERRKPLG